MGDEVAEGVNFKIPGSACERCGRHLRPALYLVNQGLAQLHPAVDFAGVVIPSGVDADGHLMHLSGALIEPFPGRYCGVVTDFQALFCEVFLAPLQHGTAAAPAVRWVVRFPIRMIHRQDDVMPGAMVVAGTIVQGGDVLQVRSFGFGGFDALPSPGGGGGPQVGLEDRAQASWADGDLHELAGVRVDDVLFAPPAQALQFGFEFGHEPVECHAVRLGAINALVQGFDHIEPHGLGRGKAHDMGFCDCIAPVKADVGALGAKVPDRGCWRQVEVFNSHRARVPEVGGSGLWRDEKVPCLASISRFWDGADGYT